MIAFEERAVAFLDVLGFKELVKRASQDPAAMRELQRLVDLLSSVIPFLDGTVSKSVPQHLIPEHLYISDCIILSAPLRVLFTEFRNYSGLEILAMRVIQVSQLLLDLGYLTRGGLAIGNVWHQRTNIVGPAYQEALELEQTTSMPRVVLSKGATQLWKASGEHAGSRLCIDYDGNFMVNTTHDYYIPPRFAGNISQALRHYDAVIQHNLGAGLKANIQQKWMWMQRYLVDEHRAHFTAP